MWKWRLSLALMAGVLAGCSSAATEATPELVSVYASSATYPWLDEVYTCAPPSAAIELSAPGAAEIKLRFGEPPAVDSPIFQIGGDDLMVVVQPQTAVGALTLNQVRQLFDGQITRWKDLGGADLPVQVWTYSQGEDIQEVFDGLVMQGQPVASLARLAVSAQAMSDAVGSNPGSIGFLPRRWKTGNTNAVLTVSHVPVLAVISSLPQGAVRDLLACLQSKE